MDRKNILITGADGFLGSNLIRELLNYNHKVTAFVQRGNTANTIRDLDIEIQYGDILDKQSIEKSVPGRDILIHTAAHTSVWPYRSELQRRVNIEGTRNIMRAALKHKISRIVHVGTANSFGFGSKNKAGDESFPYMCGRYRMDYMDTKYEAQQLVLKMVENDNLPAVIVNPTFMFGPYPTPKGSARMIESIYRGFVPGYSRGGRNYISVKDVCAAIVNAFESGRVGESYILGNENLSYKEIFTIIADVTDSKAPNLFMPDFLVKSYGLALTCLAKLFRFYPTVNYRLSQMSVDEHYYSPQKAREELKIPQTPIKTAVKEAFDWMVKNEAI